ncbi:hypothetical protein HU200_021822 [Digitaria exilis]|uniref:Uncharacterized protein n=1 Tax=Digitaria exilis TaxID=1010633 RepID=A0A835KBK6_9POAL|nr:hypothetical protein HU200_021822 [Digitaria exilis]
MLVILFWVLVLSLFVDQCMAVGPFI